MKKIAANIALACVVTLVCIVAAEIGLRALTPFPIHGDKANKIYDKDVGYRLNPGHFNIDAHGFRNSREKPRIVAAIGDSHTYGSNVRPEEAWPEQFEALTGVPAYNFGVGSYAVYAHFANAHRAIEQGYKYIIIALFVHNDFKVLGNSCDIDYEASELWQDAKARLSLNLPDCSNAENRWTARAPEYVRWVRGRANSAILSAADYLIVRPISDLWHRSNYDDGESPNEEKTNEKAAENASDAAPANETRGSAESAEKSQKQRPASAYIAGRSLKNQEVEYSYTDLTRPEVVRGIEDFEKMLADLKRAADENGSKIGVMFIPSKVQLFYEHLRNRDVYEKRPILKDMAENHQKIQSRLTSFMDGIGLDWSTAKPELVAAVEKSEAEGTWLYPPTGSHPSPPGYRAYAEAAKKLYERMAGRSKTSSTARPPAL